MIKTAIWRFFRIGLFLLSIGACEAKKIVKFAPRQNVTANYLLYAISAIIMIIVFLGCMFLCRQICPNGPVFTALEIDEIQLERLNEVEEGIERNIRQLQQKLDSQKNKKKVFLQDRVLNLLIPGMNSKSAGDNDYPYDNTPLKQQAHNRPSPILNSFTKDSRKSPTVDYSQNSRFAPGKANKFDFSEVEQKGSGRKDADEKDDLWKLWNKVYDKDGKGMNGKKASSQDMKDESNHSKSDYAYKTIKYGDKSKSFTNKALPSPSPSGAIEMSPATSTTNALHDSYGKKKSATRSSSSKHEETGDYNHGLNKATSNVMMNLKPLSSNIQNRDSNNNPMVTPPRENRTLKATSGSQQNMSQYSINVPMQNYDPQKVPANTNHPENNEPRMDPSIPRPRPPPPKYPPPAYVATGGGDSVKDNGVMSTASSSSMMIPPTTTAPTATTTAVGTGLLRERAPQKRPAPPKGPPPPKRSVAYETTEETSEHASLLNNKSD